MKSLLNPQDRAEILAHLPRAQKDFSFKPHPIFGEMTEAEWMRWGYLHCNHHLRQFGE